MSSAEAESTTRRGRTGVRRPTREILSRLARVLAMGGEDPEVLAREFAHICGRVRVRPVSKDDATSRMDHGQVIARWYSEPEYVDRAGIPRALPYSGSRHSLSTLIARVLPEADPLTVLRHLKELGALRAHGRLYRPTDDFVSFGHRRELLIPWLLNVLGGLLRTVEHNATCRPKDRIPDRIALNPRFPVEALPKFYARLRKRGTDFLRDADLDMQRRERGGVRTPRIRLGVTVFAFEDPLVSGRVNQKTKTGVRAPRMARRRGGRR